MLFSYVQFWKFQKVHFGLSENDSQKLQYGVRSTTSLYVANGVQKLDK